ncbi:MAG: glycosyl transferase [Hyphomicrobiales bacterium]|nr:MAG: glycosyl transferase [Hyphomicrobiales bacterium]
MKILFLTSSMGGGGAERVAALLSNAWVEQEHEVVLMPTFSGRGNCAYKLHEKVDLKYLADLVDGSSNKLKRLWALRKYILAKKPDIIIAFLPDVNIAALLCAKGTGIPVIVSERIYPNIGIKNAGNIAGYLREKIYKWAKCVVVQTSGVEQWVLENCPGSETKVIPNPVVYPLPVSESTNLPEEVVEPKRKLILGTGRFHSQKRFDYLIKAFSKIATQHHDWDLAIVGEGELRPELEKLRRELKLENRVHLPGFTGAPANWYERADIFVLSSAYEGFPNSLLEAMSYGLASVAFDVKTGPSDLIINEKSGILLNDENNVSQLADALNNLIKDEIKRNEIATNALYVREKYAMSNILKMWDEILNR